MYLLTKANSWLLPVCFFTFTGPTIIFVSPYMGGNIRWVATVLLFVMLFVRYKYISLFSTQFSQIVALNILWAMLTVMWSEVPVLSLMKVIALCLVSVTIFYASYSWVISHNVQRSLDFFWLTVLFSLMAAFFGLGSGRGMVDTGGSVLYQGLVSGPNMMGSLMMMCTPLLVWKCYSNWSRFNWRMFWVACLLSELVFLLMANSRASLVASIFCVVSLFYSLGHRKWVPLLISGLLLMITVITIFPVIYDKTVELYVYKNASDTQGVLYTRESVWAESYRLAQLGGWLGGGYGVTIGESGFEAGLTAVGYGREKGNSQLAIMEESGIVGLILYGMMLFSLYFYTLKTFFLCKNMRLKVLLGISIGMTSGLVFHSIFEAWWVAPGSPEFVFFWLVIGYSIGVCSLIKRDIYKNKRIRIKENDNFVRRKLRTRQRRMTSNKK